MPGQEKMVSEYYQKNPNALDSLRGSIYEEKIINEIKKKGKLNKKEITKAEAENILKAENEKNIKEQENLAKDYDNRDKDEGKNKKTKAKTKPKIEKKAKTTTNKKKSTKKVSKK